MKVRIKFTKQGSLTYTGHLDILRYFQKALRRAEIDVTYSQGFNPHPVMSFASPLGIGLTSLGEYMDIEVNSSGPSGVMIGRLNSVMCPGIEIKSFVRLPENGKTNAMATLAAASYRVWISPELERQLTQAGSCVQDSVEAFLKASEIRVRKKTKTKETEWNIRPGILSCIYACGEFHMLLSSGSAEHLKPEAVLDALFSFLGLTLSAEALMSSGEILVCRLDMYAVSENRYVPMDQLGEEIL